MRLVGEHVEPRALDDAGFERGNQCRLVDDRSARDVDERALLAERGQHAGVDDVPGRLAAGTRDHQEVGRGGERLEIGHVLVSHILRLAAGVGDLHAHRRDALRDRLADAPEAEDADLPPAELGGELRRASLPFSRLCEAIQSNKAAAGHQDQAKRDVRDVVGKHVRRVGHLEAAFLAVRDRHAVVAHAEHRDDLELRQLIEQFARRHRAPALHQAADACAFGGEQPRLVARLIIVVTTIVRLERFVEKRWQRRGDEDVGLHDVGSVLRVGSEVF